MSPSKKSEPRPPTIFQQAYWDRPKPSQLGAQESRLLYQAVGEALSQWEHVDQELANLFIVFTCEPQTADITKHAIRRAYGSIISTAGRREAINVAAEVYFPKWMTENQAEKDGLKDVLNAAQWAAKLRDDIAHGVGVEDIEVVTREEPGSKIIKEERFGSYLMPPEYNTGRTFAHDKTYDHLSDAWKARYCFNNGDIDAIKWKFWYLKRAVIEYLELVTPYVERVRATVPIKGSAEMLKAAMAKVEARLKPAVGTSGK